MDTKLLKRYLLREIIGVLVMGAALFWPAGTLRWWQAWALLAVIVLWVAGMIFVILRNHPQLLAERLETRRGAKSWDMTIMSLVGIVQLLLYILAALDHRYGWTEEFALSVYIAALVLCALGYGLGVWATAYNAFFTQIVRLQPESGQSVAQNGPYRYIRHPAYSGVILFELAVSLLLGSAWALILGIIEALLMVLRTWLEDRALQQELPGYAAYAEKVRYRLLPGIW